MSEQTISQQCDQILARLHALASSELAASYARYGIHSANPLGISMPDLRRVAKDYRDHNLALALWESAVYEARLLASLIDDPRQVNLSQMEAWVIDFDSWGICDQVCMNLFARTSLVVDRAIAWSQRREEYVRRAGLVLMAVLPIHAKKLPDETYSPFFPLMLECAVDERLYVRKAVSWALRQIGKRRPALYDIAVETAQQIARLNTPSARWIASDVLRELLSFRRRNERCV
ncbi:MAG: DNA alkylation repair protein [Anaerolineae bacterium]|nr:DNA alkylation repair protein [Anaerolineae bacterium]